MKGLTSRTRVLVVLALVAGAIAAIAATANGHRVAVHAMTPAVRSGGPSDFKVLGPITPGVVVFGCQTRPPSAFPASSCYGPQQIRRAYSIQPLLDRGIDGRSRSITIIDAFGSPNIQAELDLFDSTFGLANTTVNVVFPDGPPAAGDPADTFGWHIESDLDVEWAHAVAPGATINFVVAKSDDDADILSATKYVADHRLGDVLSQSYGENEACVDPALFRQQTRIFAQMTRQGQTLLASAGDDGAGQPSCDGSHLVKAVSSPAVDPNVTAVGGTELNATPGTVDSKGATTSDGGQYISETTWNEYALFGDRTSTGGGVSTIVRKPLYQALVPSLRRESMRWIPDIAYNAAIQGGVITTAICTAAEAQFCGGAGPVAFRVGGTSAGSPQWAGLTALAAQIKHGSIGPLNPTLYVIGDTPFASTFFHDVTTGDNTVPAAFTGTGSPIVGFSAGPGWDAVTGFGSPKANTLVPALAVGGLLH